METRGGGHKHMQLSERTLPESLWEQAELPEEIPGKKELTVWSSIGTLLAVGKASYRWTQLLMDWLRLASIREEERRRERRKTVETEKGKGKKTEFNLQQSTEHYKRASINKNIPDRDRPVNKVQQTQSLTFIWSIQFVEINMGETSRKNYNCGSEKKM